MSKRILVVDDDEAIRKAFLLGLEDTEYQVDTAESGERGIKMQQERNYDLVFLDLRMPGMDGVKTLRELKKVNKETPVYIVTAFHGEFFEGLRAAEKDGIDFEVVRKPISADQIVMVTKSVLEGPVAF